MKRIVLAATLSVFSAWASACATSTHLSTLTIDHAWARSTAATSQNGAIYLTIHNSGKTADRLLSVQMSNAAMTQIHRSSVENGVMQMREVEGGVAIGAGKTVKFAPGGLHVMLMGLKQPLKPGECLTLKMHFEKAGDSQIKVDVRDNAAEHGDMDHMHMN